MKYLIDTNICIYLINQRPSVVLERFKFHNIGEIAISSVSVAEMFFGCEKSSKKTQNIERLKTFLFPLETLSFDDRAAKAYGKIRSYLQKKGLLIGPLDMLIASQANSNNMVLVTNNVKEFSRVPNLKIENWIS